MASRSRKLLRAIGPGLILVFLVVILLCRENTVETPSAGPGEFLFCFWNVENLFDDRDDHRGRVDEEYDNWFAHNAAERSLKFERLRDALLKMNDGRGPDILALVEVESVRAAEMLRDALNQKLPPNLKYGDLCMEEVAAGRHIAPAVISRPPTDATNTRLHGKGLRILETRIKAGDHALTILTMHWTSQLSDKTGESRDRYANIAYDLFRGRWRSDPAVDFLICGDFNTDPHNKSVTKNLRAVGDKLEPGGSNDAMLLNLMAGKDPAKFGTHYYKTPLIYDQICISPGLLDDQGWSCDRNSLAIITDGLTAPGAAKDRRPWRFGNENNTAPRGYSDHFPVVVTLKAR